jgi:16S rRNA processing protein RimM
MSTPSRVCVGQVAAPHGVRGLVKLRSFTEDPADVAAYGPLTDETGRRSFEVRLLSAVGDLWIAEVEGVADRNAAEAIKGVRLYVERSLLPEPEDEDEFYHADLIGLRAETAAGEPFGTVVAVHDFGAGEMLELRPASGPTVMLPFTRAAVPVVDLAAGRIVVEPPEEIPGEDHDGGPGGDRDGGEGGDAG